MARFNAEIPKDIIDQLTALEKSDMFERMVDAGADVVMENVKRNMKSAFKNTQNLEKCLIKSKVYHTRVDDAINDKVAFYGYFINEQGKEVPAPLVVMAREYGTSRGELKKPFFRRSFNKQQITSAMLKVQKEYIPE